ncbi:hypothetical protein NE237_013599 [Protea cynaroides]|uniref:Uncharacterized protein n=1 Tax=Protea cynaroides TaxID=273540 RepID=A0A9Q0H1A1_9MAGN|nr:hypothetical protein NE237_013599 [Protea cynaroides]
MDWLALVFLFPDSEVRMQLLVSRVCVDYDAIALKNGWDEYSVAYRSRKTLSEWFSPCGKLEIAAEHGYFFRMKRDDEWETCVPVADCSWKQTTEPVMKLYTKTSYRFTIEDKETGLVWCYEDGDFDFGSCQAKELLDHLESFLANDPVSVKSGD